MYTYKMELVRVVDGDTVDVNIDLGFGVWLNKQRIRLRGLDTPESRTRDAEEKRFGLLAKEKLESLITPLCTLTTFKDKKGDGIALRPEGTAGCVRACLEHDLLRVDSPRLWYMGPMFRYERPQKGRSRQFHQASAEVFGIKDPHIDAELIMLTRSLWEHLGINNKLSLHMSPSNKIRGVVLESRAANTLFMCATFSL